MTFPYLHTPVYSTRLCITLRHRKWYHTHRPASRPIWPKSHGCPTYDYEHAERGLCNGATFLALRHAESGDAKVHKDACKTEPQSVYTVDGAVFAIRTPAPVGYFECFPLPHGPLPTRATCEIPSTEPQPPEPAAEARKDATTEPFQVGETHTHRMLWSSFPAMDRSKADICELATSGQL